LRKRLRKKLRRGEFQELGFAIAFAVRAPVGSEAALDIIDVFITEAIDSQHLALYAGGRDEWTGFITAFDRGSVTEGQRRSVLDWLRAHPSISNVRSGPLIDVWQSREERFDVTAA
jgi:hypothetical protein